MFSSNQIHKVPFHWILPLTYVCKEFVVKMATAITLTFISAFLNDIMDCFFCPSR